MICTISSKSAKIVLIIALDAQILYFPVDFCLFDLLIKYADIYPSFYSNNSFHVLHSTRLHPEPSTDIEGEEEVAAPEPAAPVPLYIKSPLDHLVHRIICKKIKVLCLLQEEEKGAKVLCLLQEEAKGGKIIFLLKEEAKGVRVFCLTELNFLCVGSRARLSISELEDPLRTLTLASLYECVLVESIDPLGCIQVDPNRPVNLLACGPYKCRDSISCAEEISSQLGILRYWMASSSSSVNSAPQAAPPAAKKRFLRRILPALLVANVAVGVYVLLRTSKNEPNQKDERAADEIPSAPKTIADVTVPEQTIPGKTAVPIKVLPPIPEQEQRELFKWILEEKRKIKPQNELEKKKIDEEKSLLKELIRAKSIPNL
ncbi:hypothetical protein IEQ34_018377 [Dendrobium chrysotoxum]|uniref:Uncharacterized protein n=1 Tax=Dendrobium chrysotoxum TaxID=161865 RepID=A0AAV7GF83_DENCH|nr:hypothetical protein IEQ34_018377 [Dendrobium chrysotoxum]